MITSKLITLLVAAALLPAAFLLSTTGAAAHSPDPVFGGVLYAQEQPLPFRWRTGQVPPPFMQAAIRLGAAHSNASRAAKGPVFSYDPAGTSWINYGLDVTCGVNGLACFSRANAPRSFTMSFREQGHVFDWGTLKWCQYYASPPNGCYDVENIALDEFGHVQVLAHHVNRADDSDYLDAVVQTYARAKPRDGWNVHAFGPCDVASLQLKYELLTPLTLVSRCLEVTPGLVLNASSTWLTWGASVSFTASLAVSDLVAHDRMRGDPLSGRTVTLQRRPLGASTWTTIGVMTPGAMHGTYAYTAVSQTASADWRAVFARPSNEGLRAATSQLVRVSVSSCRTGLCPEWVVEEEEQ
jgi:hypothetical protein